MRVLILSGAVLFAAMAFAQAQKPVLLRRRRLRLVMWRRSSALARLCLCLRTCA